MSKKIKSWISKSIKELKKKTYHIVPPCPLCESNYTGYFKQSMDWRIDEHSEIIRAMENGEFIKIVTSRPENNCFCLQCGAEWYFPIKKVRIDKSMLEEYKKQKGIDKSIINDYVEEIDAMKNYKKRKNKGRIRKAIFRYVKKKFEKAKKDSFLLAHSQYFEKINDFDYNTSERDQQ